MSHETRVTRLHVVPPNEPIFHEMATTVEVVDDASGEHIKVQQFGSHDDAGALYIDPAEWPALRAAINRMVKQCRPDKE